MHIYISIDHILDVLMVCIGVCEVVPACIYVSMFV